MITPRLSAWYTHLKNRVSIWRALFFGTLACIIIGAFLSGIVSKVGQVSAQVRIEQAARAVLAVCEGAPYRPTCYEEEIPKLMDEGVSMEDAFKVTQAVQRTDPSFVYCHVLGHKLSAKEAAKDPSKWKDVAARSPIGVCSYGGLHGAFQERFRSEWLEPAQFDSFIAEVEGVCKARKGWQPTGVQEASCMHAMGHLTMFVANGEVPNALDLCQRIVDAGGGRDSLPLCFDGVFMQMFQPLEPEDFALVEGVRPVNEADAVRFCDVYSGDALSSCTSERWPYSSEVLESDPQALVHYCAVAPTDTEERFCFLKMVNLMTARKQFSPQQMIEYCAPIKGWRKKSCIVNATSRMLENDLSRAGDALLMCQGETDSATAEACWQHLAVMIPYSIPNESEQFRDLCQALPAPYNEHCLSRAYRTY